MTDEEIPADVMEKAQRAWAFTSSVTTADIKDIARAILSERKRCAAVAMKVVESVDIFTKKHGLERSTDFQRFQEGAKSVATAINRGDQP